VLATVFALIAFIFSELVPEIPPIHKNIMRVSITVWFGLLGYGIFPDLARAITGYSINLMNAVTMRISTEVMNQLMRISRPQNVAAPFASQSGGNSFNQPMILDTSAIIDGRILDIAKTGFLHGTVLIPTFILQEMQQVADSSDFLKRSRGRKGFEIIEELKKIKSIRVDIWEKDVAAKAVDDKVIKLAKSLHGRIITTDYNLNRVASIQNVTVLNINDLSNAVKAVAIPGEKLTVKVVHIGKDPSQGVGYLEDGTMVVVENGAQLVGSDVKTEVTRLIQGSAGRMIFTKNLKI
jgi:uncharacterized protein YacL